MKIKRLSESDIRIVVAERMNASVATLQDWYAKLCADVG